MSTSPQPATRGIRAVARGGVLNLAGAATSGGASLLLVVIVARGAGPKAAGAFFAAISIFLVGKSIANLGTQTGLVYFLTRLRVRRQPDQVGHLLAIALVPVLVIGVAAGLALVLSGGSIGGLVGDGGTAGLAGYARILGIFLPLAALSDSILGATRGYGSMRATVLADRIIRPLLQLLLVGLAAVAGRPDALGIAWVVPYALALVVGWAWLRRRRRIDHGDEPTAHSGGTTTGEFWRYTAPRALSAVSQVGLQRLDIILVAVMVGPREAAIYTAASRFLVAGQMANQAFGQAAQPQLGALTHADAHAGKKTIYQMSTAWLILGTWPFYLACAIFAPVVIAIFGEDYGSGAPVVTILCLSMLVATACGMVDSVLVMTGRTVWNLANTLITLGVNIALNVLLIPRFGIEGAAVAWAVALLVKNLLPLVQIAVSSRTHPFGSATLRALALVTSCFGLPLVLCRVLAGTTGPSFGIGVGTGLLLLALGCWHQRAALQLRELDPRRLLRRGSATRGSVDDQISYGTGVQE